MCVCVCVKGGGGGIALNMYKQNFRLTYVIIAGISISTLPLVVDNTSSTILFLKSLKGILCHKISSKGQNYFN